MIENPPTIRVQKENDQLHVDRHIHKHHIKTIFVMLGFIVGQFFLMTLIVDASELTIQALLGCTNQIRVNHQQPAALVLNDKLDLAAENKLNDMAKYQYWAHQNPVTGAQPWDFIDAAGYVYITAGENLAYGFTDSSQICDAWEKSPLHLANIINPTFQEIGFAVDKANLHKNEKGILVVQLFGSRDDFTPGAAQTGQTQQTAQTQQAHPAAQTGPAGSTVTAQTPQTSNGNDCSAGASGCAVSTARLNAKPQIEGATTAKTDANPQDDSVHPAPQLSQQDVLGSLAGLAGVIALAAAFLMFRFKKDKKKVMIIKKAVIIFGVAAVILALLTLFSHFAPPV
jgi:hypothetical protein